MLKQLNKVSDYHTLRALQTKAKDMVAEASVSDELKSSLDNLFAFVGVTWEQKLPALPKPKK